MEINDARNGRATATNLHRDLPQTLAVFSRSNPAQIRRLWLECSAGVRS